MPNLETLKTFQCKNEQIEAKVMNDVLNRNKSIHIIQNNVIMAIKLSYPGVQLKIMKADMTRMEKKGWDTLVLLEDGPNAKRFRVTKEEEGGYALVDLETDPATKIYIKDIKNFIAMLDDMTEYMIERQTQEQAEIVTHYPPKYDGRFYNYAYYDYSGPDDSDYSSDGGEEWQVTFY
jgi:hypothetical protein